MSPNEPNPDEVDPLSTRHEASTEPDMTPAPSWAAHSSPGTEAETRRLTPDHASLSATSPQTTEGTKYQGEKTHPAVGPVEVGQTLFGKYRVIRRLGGGAMGDVYLVRHTSLNRDHALKMIVPHLASHSGALHRFQREFHVMASFHHEHAVEIYDAKLDEEGGYIDMQYVEGNTIAEVLAEAKSREDRDPTAPLMPYAWILRILGQLCEVLDVAHEAGIVHRDLKPSNLMLLGKRQSGREFLKVLDFGIAKIRHDPENNLNDATLTGGFIGTPSYSSPEQVYSRPIDGRSDLYAVGVILYEILCGRLPFLGLQVQVMMQHAQQPPPAFARSNPNLRVAPEVEKVVLQILAKDPADRPATAHELYEAFSAAVSGSGSGLHLADRPSEQNTAPYAPSWDAVSDYAPPIEPTEMDRVGPPSISSRALEVTQTDIGVPEEDRHQSPTPTASRLEIESSGWTRQRVTLAAVVAAAVLITVVALSRFTPGKKQTSVTNPESTASTGTGGSASDGGSAGKETRKDHLLPDGYRATQGTERKDGWPSTVRRDEDESIYRYWAPGIYLPDEFEVDATEGSSKLVEAWPRVIVRKGDTTRTRYLRIPGGREFVMGAWDAPEDLTRSDAPAHSVVLSGFYLQECEVTNAQLEDFYSSNATRARPVLWLKSFEDLKKIDLETAGLHPAVNLSRKDANAFARSFGGQLPTEAQWEYAARSLGQRLPYVWGKATSGEKSANIESERANVTTSPSRQYKADMTEQHVYDMAGNVQEWCRDVWSPFRRTEVALRDPWVKTGPSGEAVEYAIRGAGWSSILSEAQITRREDHSSEITQRPDLGFRVVLECPEIPLKP